MSKNNQNQTTKNADLDIITRDKRLDRLFGIHEKPCAIELWLLQLKRGTDLETRLLYGRLSPFDFSNAKWSAPNEDRFRSIRDGLTAQCVRLTAYCSSTSALELVRNLTNGMNLLDASKASSIFMPPSLDSRFGSWEMLFPLSFRPVMHLPPKDYFRFRTNRVSPLDDCSADSAAVTTLLKSEVFGNGGAEDPELARFAIDSLSADTGLEFSDLDAWRLGDLELLNLPGKTESGVSLVSFKQVSKEFKIQVEHPLVAYAANLNISVRCENDEAVFHCGTVVISKDATYPASVTISIPSHLEGILDACLIEIFAQDPDSGESALCFQWGHYLIREIDQSMQISGGRAVVKSSWLAKALRPIHSKRLEEAQQIARHTHRTKSMIGGRKADPWVTANRQMRSTAKRLLPQQSNGRFFLRYSEGENTGRLELAEWLKKLLADHPDMNIAWFDPYMEDVGITLLNQYGLRGGNYIIFTGTGKSSLPPWWKRLYAHLRSENAPKALMDSRIVKLQAACRQWSTQYGTIHLRVFGLPQSDLHDRMILIRDAQMRPVAGYHLSNSLQHANENYPLLITPIPFDVLQLVIDYADNLLRGSMDVTDESKKLDSRLKCLFDSDDESNCSLVKVEFLDIFSTPRIGEILDWWLSSSDFAAANGNALKQNLEAKNLLSEGRFENEIFEQLPSKIWIEGLPLLNFDSAWDALGMLLANTQAGTYIREAPSQASPVLRDALLKYLDSDRADAMQPRERRGGIVDMTAELKKTMDDLLTQSADPHQMFSDDGGDVSWGDYYAFEVLWTTEPATLVDWIGQGIDDCFRSNRRRQLGLRCALHLITFETSVMCTSRQLDALLNSKNELIRWIGYVAFEAAVYQDQDPQVLSSSGVTSLLSEDERLQLLGWLTARAAQRRVPVRYTLIKELLSSIPVNLDETQLRKIVNSMRNVLGNVYGNPTWIFDDILSPLMDNGQLEVSAVAKLWFEELLKTWKKCGENNGYVSFQNGAEDQFTDEVAKLCSLAFSDVGKLVHKTINKELQDHLRVVQRPFSSTIDWREYDRSLTLILWISGFLMAWLKRSPRPNQAEELLKIAETGLRRRSPADWDRSSVKALLRYRESYFEMEQT